MKNTVNIHNSDESQEKSMRLRNRSAFMASVITSLCFTILLTILFSSIIDGKSLYAQDKKNLQEKKSLYVQDDDYKIGAEDVLYISVWRNEQLSREVVVRPDGKISFPLLDDLKVTGLTSLEVKGIIAKKLALYVEDPEVTVILTGINSHRVYIAGAAGLPGVFNLKRKVTLFQLMAMAEKKALIENVDLKGAYILRGKKRLPVDFEKLIEEGDMTQDVDLLPDDIIYLPDNFEARITVIGEVKTPRVVPFKKGTTVLDAVLMSGGPTDDADLNDTKIIRKKAGKKEATETIKVRLKDVMKKGKLTANVKLQPMDLVIIPASIF